MRRRLIELVFDANEEAEKQFTFGLSQFDEAMKKRMAETKLQADPAFVASLLGSWTTAGLGEIRILRQLMLTGPPFAGLTFWPQTNNGRPGLLFETAQQKYWFERAGK